MQQRDGQPPEAPETGAETGSAGEEPRSLMQILSRARLAAQAEAADPEDGPPGDHQGNGAHDGRISVEEAVAAMGHASFIPVMMLPALLVFSPLSGIPILPSVCGMIIALIAAQMLVGRQSLWLPGVILRRTLPAGRLDQSLAWVERPARWIDAHTGKRIGWLTRAPGRQLLLLACMVSGGVMPLLELVPFTSSILGAAITIMSLALLVRDGLLALIGLAFVAGAAAVLLTVTGVL
ncbi:exopolysaccharide biosynthesis protein [Frigidibacter oleivorans]|uniref:exopolysaccharide biosynthesis protein n=1 Tax=Frigidibacter oleivorans TaxID=2487129 RepID=UPI0013E08FC2|nr:exopolysaccharide biosynthesis protein [Frigidibacter oleivorans]